MAVHVDLVPREGPNPFAWGCRVQGLNFLYVYGTAADYWRFRGQDSPNQGHTLHKGWGSSLVEVRQRAEQAAEALAPMYDGVGSVGVVNAKDHQPRWASRLISPANLPGRTERDRRSG